MNEGIGLLISYCILDSLKYGCAELLMDCFVILEEVCREWACYRGVYLLRYDREEVVGVVVPDFGDDL